VSSHTIHVFSKEIARSLLFLSPVSRPSQRVLVVTANGRNLPALMCSMEADALSNMICTCPPTRSERAGPAPRYGTCCILTPAIIVKSSPEMCCDVPLPADAKLSLPGLALT
jgi:hypothetical protein